MAESGRNHRWLISTMSSNGRSFELGSGSGSTRDDSLTLDPPFTQTAGGPPDNLSRPLSELLRLSPHRHVGGSVRCPRGVAPGEESNLRHARGGGRGAVTKLARWEPPFMAATCSRWAPYDLVKRLVSYRAEHSAG